MEEVSEWLGDGSTTGVNDLEVMDWLRRFPADQREEILVALTDQVQEARLAILVSRVNEEEEEE